MDENEFSLNTVDQVMRAAKAPRLPMPMGMMPSPPVQPPAPGETVIPRTPPVQAMRQQPAPPVMGDASLASPDAAMFSEPSSGGGPVSAAPGEAPAAPQSATPRAAVPQASPADEFRLRKRDILMQSAEMMMKGSPALRVQGLQLMFEIQKDDQAAAEAETKRKEAAYDETRSLQLIETSTADDEDKKRAMTLQQLGARPQDVVEALQFNNQGAAARKERREQYVKWNAAVSTAARDLGTMEVQEQKINKLLDESYLTTGTAGWAAQFIPGSAANKLNGALEPIRALVGYDYLKEMREASKTGGAIGNVTENETRWLMGIQGGLDPVTNDPQGLKDNVRSIIEGKRITLRMRQIAPGVDAGDPAALAESADLTRQLGRNGAEVRARMKVERDTRAVAPEDGSDFEQRYGGR